MNIVPQQPANRTRSLISSTMWPSMKRITQVRFSLDKRGGTTTVNHILALGMTSLLVFGLLIGANTLIKDQKADATRESLDTVGNQLAEKIMTVDRLSSESANATLVVSQPARVAGSSYSARIDHGIECNTPRISSDTCLVLTAASADITRKIPVTNQTDVSITQVGAGRYKLTAERSEVGSGIRPTQPVDVPESTMRHGIGRNVSKDAVGVAGDAAFNLPPANLSLRVDPERPSTNGPIELTASADDPDGDDTKLTYKWDFDDGATGTGETASHDYTTPGVYEVALTATDEDGATSTKTFNISIAGLEYEGDIQETCTPECKLRFSVQNKWNNGGIDNTVEIDGIYINVSDDVERKVDSGEETLLKNELIYGDGFDSDDWTLRVEPDDSADRQWSYIYKYTIRENGTMVPLVSSIHRHKDGLVWMNLEPGNISSLNGATIRFRGYTTPMAGEDVRIAIQHRIDGRTNTTSFTDTVTVIP